MEFIIAQKLIGIGFKGSTFTLWTRKFHLWVSILEPSIPAVLIFYYLIVSGRRTYLRVDQRNADPVIVEQEATFASVFIELLWT